MCRKSILALAALLAMSVMTAFTAFAASEFEGVWTVEGRKGVTSPSAPTVRPPPPTLKR